MKTQMLPSLQAIHLFRELSDEGDRYPLISYSATAKNIKSVSKYWNHPPLGTGGQMEKMQSKCRTVANSKRIISYSCNR